MEEFLRQLGVEVVEDTYWFVQNKSLLQVCRSQLPREDFVRFVEALQSFTAGCPDPWVEVVSTSSTVCDAVCKRESTCTLVQEVPNWSVVLAECATAYSMAAVITVDDLFEKRLAEDYTQNLAPVFIKSTVYPFCNGSSMLVYNSRILQSRCDAAHAVSHLPARVLKTPAFSFDLSFTQNQIDAYMSCYRAASFLASTYNKVRPSGTPAIEFAGARLLQLTDRPDQPFFVEEPLIPTSCGRLGSCSCLSDCHRAVSAFSHWTHHMSQKRLMVTDCQGCFDTARNTVMLTDPVVHCVSSQWAYGEQNEGEKGFDSFFRSHRCNSICWSLNLSYR